MAEPRTIAGDTNGTGVVSYALPPGVFQYVQAIRVAIDNSGGGAAQPILSISEQSGVVIADAPQGSTIPAGESDAAATWALRLTDEGGGAGTRGDTFELIVNANQAGAFPIGSLCAWVPKAALAGATPTLVSVSFVWEWEAGKQGNAAIRNNTDETHTAGIVGAWVRDLTAGTREIFGGGSAVIAAGAFAFLPWVHSSGAALLNLTNPIRPVPNATSVYAVAVTVSVF